LLLAQKKNGSAVIDEKSLDHFNPLSTAPKRDPSPSKGSTSSGGQGKGKSSAKNSDGEEEEELDSGDEAEKLDEKQLNEIDSIYRKYVGLARP
jgi:DNA repair protein RAD5